MISTIVYGVLAVVIIILIFKIFALPIKLIFKLLINCLCGLVILFVIDVLSIFTGIWIEPTFLSAAVAGIFGLPGVAVLLIVGWLL